MFLFQENKLELKWQLSGKPIHIRLLFTVTSKLTFKIKSYFKLCTNPSHSYTFNLEHNNIGWKVVRTYKEIREVHKALSKMVKAAYGVACAHIPKFVLNTQTTC